ncbi:MAG: hypothetical protein ABJP34_02130 [Erythrobacter sp.]
MAGQSKLIWLGAAATSLLIGTPATLVAQSQPQNSDEEPFVLDLELTDAAAAQRCETDQDAARISGEIIVCARKRDDDEFRLNPDIGPSYAEETMLAGDPRTPDFILDCADQGWPPGCVRLGSAKEPALLIDVTALPEAPPGSDAERLADTPTNSARSAEPEG